MNVSHEKPVQVKICGLMNVHQAVTCAEMGADAIGLIFYPKSPRFVSCETARSISKALPETVKTVGVFVDENQDTILATVDSCSLDAVQLHGNEPPSLIDKLIRKKLTVIKALFSTRQPGLDSAARYRASAYLVESGGGSLPGGNAEQWDWKQAGRLAIKYPILIAGGLSPGNVKQVIEGCRPAGIDLSSGVEIEPGKKDLAKVASLFKAIATVSIQPVSSYSIF